MPGRQIVFLCFWTLAINASAEMYTWTDEDGTVHFSDRAPAAYDPQPVTLGTSSVVPMSSNIEAGKKVGAIHRQIEKALEQERPTRRSSQTATGKQATAANKVCRKLKSRLDSIQQKLRAGYSNDRGNSLRRQRRKLSQRYSRQCVLS